MSLVDDLSLDIDIISTVSYENEDNGMNLDDPYNTVLHMNLDDLDNKPLYSFVDEDVANAHSERFYLLKNRLMSIDFYSNEEAEQNMTNRNESQDRLLLTSNVDAEFMKRNELCADSASASVVEEIKDYGPDQQQSVMWRYSMYYLVVGGEMSLRAGIAPYFAGYVFSAVIAYWSDYFDIPRWAKRRSVRSMTCILCYLQGSIVVMNSLDIACFCGIMYFRHIPWAFSSAIISILLTEIMILCISFQDVIKKWNSIIVVIAIPIIMLVNYVLPKWGIK